MRTNSNIIGKLCVIKDLKEQCQVFVEGLVIDRDANNRAKRVRLQTGTHFGEVRHPSEYELMEFVEPGEAPAILASVWPQ